MDKRCKDLTEAVALIADGARLREAVEAVIADGRVLTADLGGTASTEEAARAVMDRICDP